MARTRGMKGRFESTNPEVLESSDFIPQQLKSKGFMLKVTLYLIVLLIVSPWIFIMMKHNSLGTLSQKVSDFYDDNFSCRSKSSFVEFPREEMNRTSSQSKEKISSNSF
jgi:hypothetical protein